MSSKINKPSCSNHSTVISHFGQDFESLTKELGDLRYDALKDFLNKLSDKIARDAEKDYSGGRNALGDSLARASECISSAAVKIDKAWKISEPFMDTVSDKYKVDYNKDLVGKPYAEKESSEKDSE